MFIFKIKRVCQIYYWKTRKDSTYNLILFSVELLSLRIFSLCVKRIITKKIKSIRALSFTSKKYAERKTINAEIIEDKDANLNNNDKEIHDMPKIKKNLKDKAKITPRYVATPFPPLNFNQIGKICPMKQINADKETKLSK